MDTCFSRRRVVGGFGLLLSTPTAKAALPASFDPPEKEPVHFSWPMHGPFVEEAGGIRISGKGHSGFIAAARGIVITASHGQIIIYHAKRLLTAYEWTGSTTVSDMDWVTGLKTIGTFSDEHPPGGLLFRILKDGQRISPVKFL